MSRVESILRLSLWMLVPLLAVGAGVFFWRLRLLCAEMFPETPTFLRQKHCIRTTLRTLVLALLASGVFWLGCLVLMEGIFPTQALSFGVTTQRTASSQTPVFDALMFICCALLMAIPMIILLFSYNIQSRAWQKRHPDPEAPNALSS